MQRLTSFLAIALLSACANAHQARYEVSTDVVASPEESQQALVEEADRLWEARGDKAQLEAALAKYEEVLSAEPTNRDALYKLVRGWYFLGDGHLDILEDQLAAWDTSITWGKRCLAVNTEFVALLEKGEAEEEVVEKEGGKNQ